MKNSARNAFYFCDNLHILREYLPDESVDLVYLDPPLNSNASCNLLFKSPDKNRWADAQIAFIRIWLRTYELVNKSGVIQKSNRTPISARVMRS